MRVLCEAPQSPASLSPAVGVADGFPYPLGGGGVAKAKRPIDRFAIGAGTIPCLNPLSSVSGM